MAYDEDLADRIRELFDGEAEVGEKRMFGGLAFLVGGKMAVAAISRGGIMVRVDHEEAEALGAERHAHPVQMRGRPVRGWLQVDAEGIGTKPELERWVALGVAYAGSLPAKS